MLVPLLHARAKTLTLFFAEVGPAGAETTNQATLPTVLHSVVHVSMPARTAQKHRQAYNDEKQGPDGIKQAGGEPVTHDLRRIAPPNIEGVNLRGTFDFPVERFAQRILPSSVNTKDLSRRRMA